jgi:predicted nucleic acid-binding Zn ribbon protein
MMPTYSFKNKKTGKVKEYVLKLSEYDKFKEDHPELERVIDAVAFNYSSHGQGSVTDIAAKKDGGWREMLSRIGQQNPDSQLNADYTKNKTLKRLKAESIVEKHAKKQEKARSGK